MTANFTWVERDSPGARVPASHESIEPVRTTAALARKSSEGGIASLTKMLSTVTESVRLTTVTVMVTTCIADTLIRGYDVDPGITSLLDQVEVLVVPVSNPDGYVHTWTTDRFWRKNRGRPFGIDLNRVRFLAPSEHSDELFYAEATRHVKKDNTFSFEGRRYETPVDLHNREVQLRYDRGRPESPVILYYQNERLGAARLLDAVANGLARRKEQA